MTTNRSAATARGMSLLEVMVAFAILSVSLLGLMGGLAVASTANGWAAARTQMSEFAQSRLERFAGQNKGTICSTVATDIQGTFSCSAMVTTGTFNPDVAANTGGWMMDVIDWPNNPPVTGDPGNSNYGDDLMTGPIVVLGDSNAVDTAQTISQRYAAVTAWGTSGGVGKGCDSALVTSNPAVLCREIHIEPADMGVGTDGGGPQGHMLNVWVRVLRGGTTDWHIGSVVLQESFAQ